MFWTKDGIMVPAVTADQMREVDRITVDVFGLDILQMMEHAGHCLALNAIELLGRTTGEVTILAGAGGNGGGGLCAARHLHNRGIRVNLVLDREASALREAAANQLHILQVTGLRPVGRFQAAEAIGRADLVVDALIGYSLRGAPRGRAAELIELGNEQAKCILSLDVPSGRDATTGETPGLFVRAKRTMILALPKTGLRSLPGELTLADIGIPPEVYRQLGIVFEPFWGNRTWVHLDKGKNDGNTGH
jgi:NAD(P)H-hydrate epimerase